MLSEEFGLLRNTNDTPGHRRRLHRRALTDVAATVYYATEEELIIRKGSRSVSDSESPADHFRNHLTRLSVLPQHLKPPGLCGVSAELI